MFNIRQQETLLFKHLFQTSIGELTHYLPRPLPAAEGLHPSHRQLVVAGPADVGVPSQPVGVSVGNPETKKKIMYCIQAGRVQILCQVQGETFLALLETGGSQKAAAGECAQPN